MNSLQNSGLLRSARFGFATFTAAIVVAGLMNAMDRALTGTTGKLALYGLLAGLTLLPPALYVLRHGRSSNPSTAFMWLFAAASSMGVAIFLFGVSDYLAYPADFLMWSETDFVNDILKFRANYPIFSAEANNESYTYTPGSQLLTYGLASLTGHSTSLPAMRAIQLFYTALAVVLAAHTTKRLIDLGSDPHETPFEVRVAPAIEIAMFGMLFLFATNALTNPFIFNLHNDALAQLISVLGFALLVEYAVHRDRRILIAMLFVPAVGFLVKQNLALWGGYYCVYLLFLDRPRSLGRVVAYGAFAFAILCAAIFSCYLIWGEDFSYWVFFVLSKHESVPARSIQHAIDIRAYVVLGLVGALLIIRGANFFRLLGLWLIWLLIMLLAIYTGGINFMRHHMGPASLIAGVWFMAGLLRAWPRPGAATIASTSLESWLRGGIAAALAALLAGSGLGILRSPKPPLNDDAYRYLAAIEREFEGFAPGDVLLDLGSYIYLESNTVMKDRASPIGERGSTDTGDLSGAIARFNEQHYAKLLLRNYGTRNFWYDHPSWPRSSGIQRLLESRYREVGRIPAVAEPQSLWSRTAPYGFGEISILVPRSADDSTTNQQ